MDIVKKIARRIVLQYKVFIAIAIYVFVMWITGIGCIFKWLTGIPCPGCGLTRSCVAFLELDFAKAFEYHALTLIIIPFLFYIIIGKKPLFKSIKIEMISYILITTIFIAYYIFRLFFTKNDIIYIDINGSVVLKLVKTIKEMYL